MKFEVILTGFQFLLISDVSTDLLFVEAHGAHAVTGGPEVQAGHPRFPHQFPVDPHRTLTLEKTDRRCHAKFRRDPKAQVDVIGHRVPFDQFDPFLTAQTPQDQTDLFSLATVEDFASVLRYDHDVIDAVPTHMGLTSAVSRLNFRVGCLTSRDRKEADSPGYHRNPLPYGRGS